MQPVVREFFRVIVSAISISGNGNPIVGSARRHATPVVRSSFPSLRNLAGSVAMLAVILRIYAANGLSAVCSSNAPIQISAETIRL